MHATKKDYNMCRNEGLPFVSLWRERFEYRGHNSLQSITGLVIWRQDSNAFEDTQVARDTNPHLYFNQKNSIENKLSEREYYLNRTQSFQLLDEKLVFYEPRKKWVECYHKIAHGLKAPRGADISHPSASSKTLSLLDNCQRCFNVSHNQLFM